MTIIKLTCMTFALFLLSTVFGDELTSDEVQICAELCENCDGIGSYINDRCECYIDDKNEETVKCIDEIKEKAAEQNLTLVNIQRNLLDRSTRCCPNSGRLRLNDIVRIAKYFMSGGARTGTRIIGDRSKSFSNRIIDTANCQRCLDDDFIVDDDYDNGNNDYESEDSSLDLVLPPEESIDYLTTPTPLVQYIVRPQTSAPIQNAYSYNDYNEPNIASFDQIQSAHNCYSSSLVPPSPVCDCSRNQLSPLLPSSYPLTSISPLTSQVHLAPHHQHHLHRGFIESSLTHLPSSNYPQYSFIRVPQYNSAKFHKNGFHRNPFCYCSTASKIPNFGTRIRQPYRSVIPGWPRPIVQPLHTFPSAIMSPVKQLPSVNNLGWSVAPRNNLHYGLNQLRISPYSGYGISNENYYPVEPILGAANPNIAESNKNHNEGEMLNVGVQQVTTENSKENQLPISSMRSDIAVQPEKPTLSTPMTLNDRSGMVKVTNSMKRTLPASIRYRQMNKRGLKIIT
ncbi:hypothetical protein PV327_002146 [Microctonus hyperodae]|uniref:Uncharacterized protein n=1 Tax=Microctonus hyperodae TaxID=165561 RepID=A0AA39FEY4_MICHY|nr:hypothetical protein PV327_002146 [Microctonus hyperodae]